MARRQSKKGDVPPAQDTCATRTPAEVWQRSPEIIQRFLEIRRDYEQLCAEIEYILRVLPGRVRSRGVAHSAELSARPDLGGAPTATPQSG